MFYCKKSGSRQIFNTSHIIFQWPPLIDNMLCTLTDTKTRQQQVTANNGMMSIDLRRCRTEVPGAAVTGRVVHQVR